MPRTVESIVSCHQAARELRRAGKPVWSYHVALFQPRAVDAPSLTDEEVADRAKEYAAGLKAALPAAWLDMDNEDFDEDLDIIIYQLEEFDTSSMHQDPADELNAIVDTLYDWADSRRVWIEFKNREIDKTLVESLSPKP